MEIYKETKSLEFVDQNKVLMAILQNFVLKTRLEIRICIRLSFGSGFSFFKFDTLYF
jgi:hypothetical protein